MNAAFRVPVRVFTRCRRRLFPRILPLQKWLRGAVRLVNVQV